MQTTTIHPVFIRESGKSMFSYICIRKNITLSMFKKTTEQNTYTKRNQSTRIIQRTRSYGKRNYETKPFHLTQRSMENSNEKP